MNGFVQCLRILVFLILKLEGNIHENLVKIVKSEGWLMGGRCMGRRSKGRNLWLLY